MPSTSPTNANEWYGGCEPCTNEGLLRNGHDAPSPLFETHSPSKPAQPPQSATPLPPDEADFPQASHLIRGDFTFNDAGEARHLLAGATSFFRSLKHEYNGDYQEGLQSADEGFQDEWGRENKSVFMFSGCKDEQTSADAFINGRHVGEFRFLKGIRD